MNWTRHALKRSSQRGIPLCCADIIFNYGELIKYKDGCSKYKMSKKSIRYLESELKKTLQLLDKVDGRTIVCSESDGSVITIY